MVKMKKKFIYLIGALVVLFISFTTYYHFNKLPQNQQITQSRYIRGHNIPGKLYWAGSAQDKEVALTFDDGPEEEWTPKILDILKQKNVKATFFVIGKQAKKYPEQLQRINSDGRIIGNHTFSHANLKTRTTSS
jgi:peptidoglycan/xylan/chitin deacetylase (PgdA/CDA1 family)